MRKKIWSIVILFFFSFSVLGQKLNSVQQTPLNIPSNVKIDGKSLEWNDNFYNYNKAVDVYYNIANDENNLYLILKATDRRIIQKIIYVGVSFIINPTGVKKETLNETISIQYPKLTPKEGSAIIWAAGARADLESTKVKHLPDTAAIALSERQKDSLRRFANQQLLTSAKMVKVKGIPSISDTLLSIYNTERIKVYGAFDLNGHYVYELSIPLKLVNIDKTNPFFAYRIKLNSRYVEPQRGMILRFYYPVAGGGPVNRDPDYDSTTDFWGVYAKQKEKN